MRLLSEGGLGDISYATLCFLEQKEDQQRKDQDNSTEVKEQQFLFFSPYKANPFCQEYDRMPCTKKLFTELPLQIL